MTQKFKLVVFRSGIFLVFHRLTEIFKFGIINFYNLLFVAVQIGFLQNLKISNFLGLLSLGTFAVKPFH